MFKKIKGYHYEVSDKGEVRNIKTRKILKPQVHRDGYLQIILWKNGKRKTYKIHRLVLETFVGPCPKGMEGCHNNGNHKDNRIENLRWDIHKNNSQDSIKHGTQVRGSKHGRAKLTDDKVKEIRARYVRFSKNANICTLAKEFGVHNTVICNIVNNKNWKHIK